MICLFVLTLLHFQSGTETKKFFTKKFSQQPEKLDGVIKTFLAPYGEPSEEGFSIIYNKQKISVHYQKEHEPPRFGEIGVHGVVKKEGHIQALAVHNYDYNYVIYILSFLAGIFVLACFLKEWKITRRGIESA